LNNIMAGVREHKKANRTREAGHLDEIQGVMANTLNAFRNGAVGFIDSLGLACSISPIPAKNEFWNTSEHDRANNCYGANPFPPGRSKRQKPKPISKRGDSAKNQKRSCEAAVNAAAARGVEQTR
jgi:hypothetical protein